MKLKVGATHLSSEQTMLWFGKKASALSPEERGAIIMRALNKSEDGDKSPLRKLIALSIGPEAGLDSAQVSALLQDIKTYGALGPAKGADVAGWWEKADTKERRTVLELANAYITSR
jgi:hypothetical protein